MNNKTDMGGSWAETKAKLKQQFAKLMDTDTQFTEKKLEKMLDRLQKKLGKTKEEVMRILREL